MASNTASPKKALRVKPKTYSTCLLYNTAEASRKLHGISLAACNPSSGVQKTQYIGNEISDAVPAVIPDITQLAVSDVMSCNYCDAMFTHRLEQKRHYRSDWHRYNLKQRLKGRDKITEELFEEISGNISSLSGSDTSSDSDSDSEVSGKSGPGKRLPNMSVRQRLAQSANASSTDSESDSGNQADEAARRLPKVYFKNKEGEMLSIWRCVLYHKKNTPGGNDELVSMATTMPGHMTWAIFMAGGGHFAGAVFNNNEMVAHKTFHRYVVRAKRGTAQGSKDSQGNAPKSAGASLRRYNESMLIQDVQELITSWSEHIAKCDRIFLRAPSFNKKIFFSGKTPPLDKDDTRIRLVPFQTRRPTHNEVRRVYEMLASIECYGDEAYIQDLVPISPPQVFNPETGQLTTRDENQMSPRQRKMMSKKHATTSPLLTETFQASSDTDDKRIGTETKTAKLSLPDHIVGSENMSSGTSTASDTEMVETMVTINFSELKEFACSRKPKKKKKSARKRRNSEKCQPEPESDIMDEEKYHLKNSLYTACKTGDKADLKNLLAVFSTYQLVPAQPPTSQPMPGQQVVIPPVVGDNGNSLPTQQAVAGETDTPSAMEEIGDIQQVADNVTKDATIIQDTVITTSECDTSDKTATINNHITNNIPPQVIDETVENNVENTVENADSIASVKDPVSTRSEDNNIEIPPDDNTTSKTSCRPETSKHSLPLKATTNIPESNAHVSNSHNHESNPSLGNHNTYLGQPDMSPVVTIEMLSEPFGDNNTTLLHVSAKEGHGSIVNMLLQAGANPALRDKSGLTPYTVSKDKATRNEFRRFMSKFPDKYDYTAAQIPGPLTEEMEQERKRKEAEKKKASKKVKAEQQKVRRVEEDKRQAEQREKNRFLNLSDREKRALAAEKRLVSQYTDVGANKPVLSRCFQCGGDMTGKVPFEYCDNKFCTSKCLQVHRKSQAKS